MNAEPVAEGRATTLSRDGRTQAERPPCGLRLWRRTSAAQRAERTRLKRAGAGLARTSAVAYLDGEILVVVAIPLLCS